MKKLLTSNKLKQALLAVFLALTLPFQAIAGKPEIITTNLPEALTGSFYSVQLLAEDTGKNAVWQAEGLPQGLELDPVTGKLFGTVNQEGIYNITITAKRRGMWKPRPVSRQFRLHVLRQPARELEPQLPSGPPVPPPPPESTPQPVEESKDVTEYMAGDLSGTIMPVAGEAQIEWKKLWANGESGIETSTKLFFKFSQRIQNFEYDIGECIEIKPEIEIGAACWEESGGGYVIGLEIGDISGSFEDGTQIEVSIIHPNMVIVNPENGGTNPASMTAELYVRSVDLEKAESDANAIAVEDMLGENTSASEITSNLLLPDTGTVNECGISWQSDDSGVISSMGEVKRPAGSRGDAEVTLTATVTCGEKSAERDFLFNVKALPEISPEIPPEISPGIPPEIPSGKPDESLPQVFPGISPSKPQSSGSGGSPANNGDTAGQAPASSNVNKSGEVSRAGVISELRAALGSADGGKAVIKTQNARSIALKSLKAFAAMVQESGKEMLLYADTLTERGGVDARLYVKPSSFLEFDKTLNLGISTKGKRPQATKKFFERVFDNKVSVISCEQKGGFGAKLQIAAKIELPDDTGNLVFYSYDYESNSYSRIITAYRIDANGYLRFVTEKAGDIIVSGGALKKKA